MKVICSKEEEIEINAPCSLIPKNFCKIECNPHIEDNLQRMFSDVENAPCEILFMLDVMGYHKTMRNLTLSTTIQYNLYNEITTMYFKNLDSKIKCSDEIIRKVLKSSDNINDYFHERPFYVQRIHVFDEAFNEIEKKNKLFHIGNFHVHKHENV
jgi:hypothetical protein